MRKLAADHPHTAICCDAPGSFRKELDPTYKANRPTAEAALHHQIDLAREALEADGFPVWRVDGFEGDDLIATATLRSSRQKHGSRTVGCQTTDTVVSLIASADKDLLALVSDLRRGPQHAHGQPHRAEPRSGKARRGPVPGDGLPDARGRRQRQHQGREGHRAQDGRLRCSRMFGNLDDVYRALDAGEAGLKPAQLASLEELRPRLDAVRALVTMRTDVPLDVPQVFKPRVPKVAEAFMEDEDGRRARAHLQSLRARLRAYPCT